MINFKIYQINTDRDLTRCAFRPYGSISRRVNPAIYDRVYAGTVDGKDLEDVYQALNIAQPDDYKGRSLSVSDVVEVVNSDTISPGFYYCDTIGWKSIHFDPERVGVVNNVPC